MPIYEYVCKKCGEVTEHLVLGKAENPAARDGGSEEVVKLMSAANVGAASPSFSPPQQAAAAAARPAPAGTPEAAVPVRKGTSLG